MRTVLHILTRPDDSLALNVIALQQKEAENEIIVKNLTEGQPDYKLLLERIFEADSVQVW